MKVIIFLGWKPVITETFIKNELDILSQAGIDFRIYCIDHFSGVLPEIDFKKYENKIINISELPKAIIPKLIFIFRYQLELFLHFPLIYSKLLFSILINHNKSILRSFFRLSPFIPEIFQYKSDLIYSHYTYYQAVFAGLLHIFLNRKFGILTHERNFYGPLSNNIQSQLKPSFVIVKNNEVKKHLLEEYPYLSENFVIVLPWGINTCFFNKNKKLIKNNKLFKIISISQFAQKKGFDYLLKACKQLVNEHVKFLCEIYGNGPEHESLRSYIRMNKIEKFVRLLPTLSHSKKMLDILSRADLFILPSMRDSMGESDIIPNALLEAMAMELPVITTKASGMEGYVHQGINGFFVKEKDPDDLVRMIKVIMDMSAEEKSAIGKRARETVVKYFDKEKQGEKFVRFLRSQITSA